MIKNSFFQLIFLFLFFPWVNTQAQSSYNVQVKHFLKENGLLHRSVHQVLEDDAGFLWIGTDKGLQRFNGHNFKTWTKKDKTGKIYEVTLLLLDQESWLWIWNNTIQEFVFLNTVTEEILSQEERFGKDFPFVRNDDNGGFTNGIGLDSKGRIVALSKKMGKIKDRIIIYDKGKDFTIVPIQAINSKHFDVPIIDSKDQLWVREYGESSNLHTLNLDGELLATYPFKNGTELENFIEIDEKIQFSEFYEGKHYLKELAQDGSIKLLKEEVSDKIHTRFVNEMHWTSQGFGWEVYDASRKNLLFRIYRDDYHQSLFDYISHFYRDSRGRLWVSSKLGLSLVIINPAKFKTYFSFQNEQSKPLNNSARGILVDEDSIYVNFEFGGLVNINKKDAYQFDILDLPDKEDYYGRPLLKLDNGDILSGHPFKVKKISPDKKVTDYLSFPKSKGFTPGAVWSLYSDNQKGLWIGTDKMLVYNPPNSKLAQYPKSKGEVLKMQGEKFEIYHILPSLEKDKLWICGTGFIYLYDQTKFEYVARYGPNESGQYQLPANSFHHLYIDKVGIHWLATNEGLIRWDLSNNSKRLFTTVDGLSNEVIYALFEDQHNRLWMSSDYGIMQMDKETFQIKSYLPKDGISHHEFNRTSAFQDKDGTIYFGSMNGITAFHPNDFYEDQIGEKPFKLQISDFEYFSSEEKGFINETSLLRQTNAATFQANDRFFRLKFSIPILDDPKQTLFAWKIDGLEENWNYQQENTIQIAQLPYGKQVLRIKGQGNDGKWIQEELKINFHVLKPIYLQTWFMLSAILCSLAGLFIFYRIRTQQFKAQQQILESEINKATAKIQADKTLIEQQSQELLQLDKTKSRFFANISHELRTPLTLILGPINSVLKSGELNTQNFSFLKKAQMNGKQLLQLVGTILDLSKMESGKMKLREEAVMVFPLIRQIISNFESHAQRSGIDFIFEFKADQHLQVKLDKEKFTTIINNLLSNAMKFTASGGQITLIVEDLAKVLLITVKDTGRGIHPEDISRIFDRFYQSNQPNAPTEGGTGIGLALSQELSKIMKGKLWVESQLGLGASFFLEIPRVEVFGVAAAAQYESDDTFQETNLEQEEAKENLIYTESSKQHTILVVEDNYSLRDYIEKVLAPQYQVITAEQGKKALKVLQEKVDTIHLVLSDIMMPVMDGYQLLKKLKQDESYSHLPVIMLTARADVKDKLKALRIGVDDYLLKPFDEEELLARIDNLLQNATRRNLIAEVQQNDEASDSKAQISLADQTWLAQLEQHILRHMDDSRFGIEFLSQLMLLSRRQLQRKIIKLLGVTPKEYVNEVKLHEVRKQLELGAISSVKEAARFAGYSNSNYFSQQFKKRFGKSPSDFIN